MRQSRGDLAQDRTPMGEDRLAGRAAALGQPGPRGAPVELIDGQGRQPAALETTKQAARRRQRDADRAATSPIRAPSASSPSTSRARHCGKCQVEAGVRLRLGTGS